MTQIILESREITDINNVIAILNSIIDVSEDCGEASLARRARKYLNDVLEYFTE